MLKADGKSAKFFKKLFLYVEELIKPEVNHS